MLEITGEVDLRHATLTQLTLDGVAVGKGGLEVLKLVGHMTPQDGPCDGGPPARRTNGQWLGVSSESVPSYSKATESTMWTPLASVLCTGQRCATCPSRFS